MFRIDLIRRYKQRSFFVFSMIAIALLFIAFLAGLFVLSIEKDHELQSKVYCDYDEIESSSIEIAGNFYTSWAVFCIEGYAATHALAPGESYYLTMISRAAPSQPHQRALPPGQVAIRSNQPVKMSRVNGRIRVVVDPSDTIDLAKDIQNLSIDVEMTDQNLHK